MTRTLVLGTRGSPLAVVQAEWVASQLRARFPSLRVALRRITTTGDRVSASYQRAAALEPPQTLRPPSGSTLAGGGASGSWRGSSLGAAAATVGDTEGVGTDVGLFVKELELALLTGEIDAAVHSLKDLPSVLPVGLTLGAVPQRVDPRDALLLPESSGLTGTWRDVLRVLSPGARVGTGSLRRHLQLLALRPDLRPVPIRGNVATRLAHLDQGACDVLLLAAAGLSRLGYQDRIAAYMPADRMIPAPGQGALAVECRADDEWVLTCLAEIDQPNLRNWVAAERAFMRATEAGCRLPVGAIVLPGSEHNGRQSAILSGFFAEPAPDGSGVWRCAWGTRPLPGSQGVPGGFQATAPFEAAGMELALELKQTIAEGRAQHVSMVGA